MTDPTLSASVRDFYLARQPILDRKQGLFGYDMLFRGTATGPANVDTDIAATASVIAHAAQLGLERVIGDAVGFIDVDAEVIMSDIVAFMPREKMVLKIMDSVSVTPLVLARITELMRHGFRFALGDVVRAGPGMQQLLPFIDYLLLDLGKLAPADLTRLCASVKQGSKKLLAEKVETRGDYELCMGLGCDYFQGFYFAAPAIIGGRKLSPSQLAVIELMALVASDTDNANIERAIKRDITLAVNLLRLANSAAIGMRYRIDSLSGAINILGRRQLQRWLQIMLYAEPSRPGSAMTPLLALASTRARMLELLAQRLRPGQRSVADVAFTVGIMSLMDTLFGIEMAEILTQIPVIDEVADALLRRSGFFGELLHLAECIERMEDKEGQVAPALRQLALSTEDLVELEVAAFEWTDTVVRLAI